MRTTILLIILLFFGSEMSAQGAHGVQDCFGRIKQNHLTAIPATLLKVQKRLAAIDFYMADHQKVIKRVVGKPTFEEDDSDVYLDGGECDMMDNYNIFRMYVRKRGLHKGMHPRFSITAYEFSDAPAAAVFYEKILVPISRVTSDKKHAYNCLLSGRYCYIIETPAYMFAYDFMDKVINAIDKKGKNFSHF